MHHMTCVGKDVKFRNKSEFAFTFERSKYGDIVMHKISLIGMETSHSVF